jgi:hypothetical protein
MKEEKNNEMGAIDSKLVHKAVNVTPDIPECFKKNLHGMFFGANYTLPLQD